MTRRQDNGHTLFQEAALAGFIGVTTSSTSGSGQECADVGAVIAVRHAER
jgi:hypothetical protein